MGNAKQELGRRIRQAREERGLSQSQVARELGVLPSTVNHWEAGRSRPDDPWLVAQLAGLLHVSMEYLLGTAEPCGA